MLSKPVDDSLADLPQVGTEVWDALNRRRAELIDQDVSAKLEGPELHGCDAYPALVDWCGAE